MERSPKLPDFLRQSAQEKFFHDQRDCGAEGNKDISFCLDDLKIDFLLYVRRRGAAAPEAMNDTSDLCGGRRSRSLCGAGVARKGASRTSSRVAFFVSVIDFAAIAVQK
jgi:hypothetical protein